jgi:hypothetical protein
MRTLVSEKKMNMSAPPVKAAMNGLLVLVGRMVNLGGGCTV